MFCFQCQETAKNTGCTVKGVCWKPEETANLQDLLIYALRGIAVFGEKAKELGIHDKKTGLFVAQGLFATITNANWDNNRFVAMIKEALKRREALKEAFELDDINDLPISYDIAWYEQKAVAVLLALLFLGVKGIRLGPTIPAFFSPNVLNVLVEKFHIKPINTVEADIEAMMAGK